MNKFQLSLVNVLNGSESLETNNIIYNNNNKNKQVFWNIWTTN